MALVSTGQITIVDNNDAKPLTVNILPSNGTQQVFSKDESTINFTPSWYTASNSSGGCLLTASVYAGGVSGSTNVTGFMTTPRFVLAAGAAAGAYITTATTAASLGLTGAFVDDALAIIASPFFVTHDSTGSTIRIKGNFSVAVMSTLTIFYEADYTDPTTGLTSHVVTHIPLNALKTGTNAVFVITRGNTSITAATNDTKNVAVVAADLVRSGGVIDTTDITYRFFKMDGVQIGNTTPYFGMKSTAAGTAPTGSQTDIGTASLPLTPAFSASNTLVISEQAVANSTVFKVEAKDADGKTFVAYFTVYDVSDPYTIQLVSSTGDKLQNGQGSTAVNPRVFTGKSEVTALGDWTFNWYLRDNAGNRAGWTDTNKIATAGGGTVLSNTATTITLTAVPASAFVAGDIVKVIKTNGAICYWEVASYGASVINLRSALGNSWLTFTASLPAGADDIKGARIFGCVTANLGRKQTTGAATIVVTGDDIDVKGTISIEANLGA